MERKFELATTRDFNGLKLNCYRENGQDDLSGEFWMTREQIGQLLEYELPRRSIAKIHERNKERIDRFSRVVKMTTHEKKRDVIREVTIYNFKGLLEICRYSTQPNAHKVIDVLWDIADEIQKIIQAWRKPGDDDRMRLIFREEYEKLKADGKPI